MKTGGGKEAICPCRTYIFVVSDDESKWEFGVKMSKKFRILVLSSNEETARLKSAFKNLPLANVVFYVHSVQEAKAWLDGEGIHSDRSDYPLPQLMLLDLEMPNSDVFEFIRWTRHNPDFERLPLVVLTGEEKSNGYIDTAYDLGANSYLIKPIDLEGLIGMAKQVRGFWVLLGQIPMLF